METKHTKKHSFITSTKKRNRKDSFSYFLMLNTSFTTNLANCTKVNRFYVFASKNQQNFYIKALPIANYAICILNKQNHT